MFMLNQPHFKPILNASLPSQFRKIHIELAREPDHPDGDSSASYVILAALDSDSHIDSKLWREYRDAFRVTRLRPNEPDSHGHLVRGPGGRWFLRYDDAADLSDEAGIHFSDERFMVGEYVSIGAGDRVHTYRVTSISSL
jgi:hypothetical protein